MLVSGGGTLVRRLQALAPDLELTGVPIDDAARRVTESRPAVFAWLEGDAPSGLALLRALRLTRPDTRTLFLTPRSAEAERLAALESGVDEVLAEPVTRSELAGRLRLLARRARPVRRSRLPIGGDIELDLDRRALWHNGIWVHLRPKEARLLELFARTPGRVLSRALILERVWGPGHQSDPRTVDVHVRWLRTKIEPDPHVPTRLLTVRGIGYRLETPAADVLPLTER